MRGFKQACHARRSNRTAAVDRFAKGHRLAITHEQFGCCRRRCGLASVVSLKFATGGVVVQQKGTATQTRRVRFNQIQYELHSDHRIAGSTSGLKDLQTRGHGQRMRSRNHMALRVSKLLFAVAAGGLRLRRPIALRLQRQTQPRPQRERET